MKWTWAILGSCLILTGPAWAAKRATTQPRVPAPVAEEPTESPASKQTKERLTALQKDGYIIDTSLANSAVLAYDLMHQMAERFIPVEQDYHARRIGVRNKHWGWALSHFLWIALLLWAFGMALAFIVQHPIEIPSWRGWLLLAWACAMIALWAEFFKPDHESLKAFRRSEPQMRIELARDVQQQLVSELRVLRARIEALEHRAASVQDPS